MLEVIAAHREHADALEPSPLSLRAGEVWRRAEELGHRFGFRNAQVTVLAPTGTIGLLMDCDTTGVEPDIALVKHKRLVGGGTLEWVNQIVPLALEVLGYSSELRQALVAYVATHGTIEGAPGFRERDIPVFDCAFAHGPSGRSIAPKGHVLMMAAVQPFLSGAISKTVNLPHDASAEDIVHVFEQGHRLGLKAVAVYRDGCKRVQPLSAAKGSEGEVPPCPNCGGAQVRSGSCFVCANCGETTACA